MPPRLQVKLLRVLETHKFQRVGGERERFSNARIIAASNRDPDAAVAAGMLREDLYFRIAGFPIHVPPLRERGNDIMGLIRFFLDQFNRQSGSNKILSHASLEALQAYAWPGNVRELRSVIEQAYIMADITITPDHLPDLERTRRCQRADTLSFRVGETLKSVEQKLLVATLSSFAGDKAKTAQTLGISLKTVYNHLSKYAETDRSVD